MRAQPGNSFISAEAELEIAKIQLVHLDQPEATLHAFDTGTAYWLDISLTPRVPTESARYVSRWAPHRFAPMGAVSIMPPGERVEVRSEAGRRSSLICKFDAAAVDRWLKTPCVLTESKLESMLDVASADLRDPLQRLAREMQSPERAAADLIQSIAMQLSIELARQLAAFNEGGSTGGLSAWCLRTIDRRLAEAGPFVSLSELAALTHLSVRQLTRAFRASRGCSIGEYRTQFLIDNAKRLLATDQSISAIAVQTGFVSPSAFTSAFRAATGATPRQYRNRIRQPSHGQSLEQGRPRWAPVGRPDAF